MAPVINIFKNSDLKYKTYILVTAQHREMLDQVLRFFNISPNFDLNIMSNNQSLETLTAKISVGVSNILNNINPDLVFVQGDTTTTFAASIASYYKKIPVAHIEAGLRTNNRYSPFPEEINRRLTSSVANFHFPPTIESAENLKIEQVDKEKISITGNTVIDALMIASKKIDEKKKFFKNYFFDHYNLEFNKKIILVTGHRRENFGIKLENICYAIKKIAENHDVNIVYPVHLNPNVQEPAKRILNKIGNIFLIPPLEYPHFVFLMKNSYLILSDSGGIQEEAPSLGKPVLISRDTTERPEGIAAGTSSLIGVEKNQIFNSVSELISNPDKYNKMSKASNPYGDGSASKKIYDFIEKNLQ